MDLPRMTSSMDLHESHKEPLDFLEHSLFQDMARPGMSQVEENFPFENKLPSAIGETLLGDRYAATPQQTSFSFQTSSSSSFSMSSGSDGKAHQQVMQMRTQRGSDGRSTKSVSHSRACID